MYKVRNKLNCPVKYKGIIFEPNETKIIDDKPSSDKFHVEKIEEQEKKKTERRNK